MSTTPRKKVRPPQPGPTLKISYAKKAGRPAKKAAAKKRAAKKRG